MKRYSVRWAAAAREDLDRIVSYIAAHSLSSALNVADTLEEMANTLHTFPRRGHVVPELDHHGIRQWLQITTPPWRIVYRIEHRQVVIVALIDGRRSLEDALFDRLMQED